MIHAADAKPGDNRTAIVFFFGGGWSGWNPAQFEPFAIKKAVGPLQIVHGDIARLAGYCDAIAYYRAPVERWRKTYEDRTFRWLLRTQGVPIEVPGVYRIKHLHKGRYQEGGMKRVRRGLRQLQAKVFGRTGGEGTRKSETKAET